MIVEPGAIDQLSDRTRQMEGAFTASFDNKIGNELRNLFSQAEHAKHAEHPSTPSGGSENDNDKLPSILVLSFEDAEEMLQKACHDEKLPEHLLKWIVSTQEYCKFYRTENTDENRVLCVSGSPGAGKSMVLLRIAQHLTRLQDPSSNDEKVACFFGNRSSFVLETPAAIVHSLIRQIIRHRPPLCDKGSE